MVSSREIIQYVQENLDKESYVSFFVVGSRPKEITPKSDIDICFVITRKDINNFFDNILKVMKKVTKNNSKITYSFIRGPIKYKYQGLIHILVYIEDGNGEEVFKNERKRVLKKYLKSYMMVQGKNLRELTKGIDLKNEKDIRGDKQRAQEKYEILKKKNYISYYIWKKTSTGWKHLRIRMIPSKFQKGYLLNYFQRNLKNA